MVKTDQSLMNLSALSGFSVELRGSPLLFLALVLLALLWAAFTYRRTVPPVGTALRIFLAALRFGALAALLFLIFEPNVSFRQQRERKPLLPVLIDDTQSMDLEDPSGKRADQLQKVITSPLWEKLNERFDLFYFAFDDSLRRLEALAPEQLHRDALGTDLSAAWKALAEEFKGEPVPACILISDGGDNLGQDPVAAARENRFPIYTVGIGDTSAVRDAALASITGDPIAYAGKPSRLTVRVRAKKMANQSASVELRDENGRLLAQRRIKLPADDLLSETTLEFTPDKAGETALQVRLVTTGEEQSLDNNLRSFPVVVHPSRIRVLAVSGYPDFESLFFHRAAAQISDVEITAFDLEGVGGKTADRVNIRQTVEKSDVVVLIHLPKSPAGQAALERLRRALEKHPLPIWVWLNAEPPPRFLEKFCGDPPVELVPARLSGDGAPEADRFYAVLDPDAQFEEAALWEDLPPVQYPPFRVQIRPPAQSLIRLQDPATGQTISPALVVWRKDDGRGALSIGSGYWRWSFLSQGLTGSAELYSGMIFKMLRWLNQKTTRKPLQLSTDKALYSSGEKVLFDARVLAGDGSPVKSAQVEVTLEGPEGSVKLLLEPDAFGRYTAAYMPQGVGAYHYEARAVIEGEPAGVDSGRFNVEAYNVEKETLRQNRELLQAISRASGGIYLPADSVASLADTLKAPPRIVLEGWSRRFFLNWDMFLLVIGLLSLEWFIRKRRGML